MSSPEANFELSDRGRAFAQRLAANPLDLFQGKTLGWLEDFILITVGDRPSSSASGGGSLFGTHTIGHMAWIGKDLSANSGEYVYEDESGLYLYLNGAAVSQTTYAELYAFYGANAYGTDSGGNFFLPDTRGRSPFCTGTHANTDLGDNDGVAVASRQALHQHTVTGSVAAHAHDVGSLTVDAHQHTAGSLTVAPHDHGGGDHTHMSQGSSTNYDYDGVDTSVALGRNDAGDLLLNRASGVILNTEAPLITGATSLQTATISGSSASASPSVTGSAGSGMVADGPAHIFIGSLVVRF